MAEDRPANDDGEGVDAAVGLTADVFADMVSEAVAAREVQRRG